MLILVILVGVVYASPVIGIFSQPCKVPEFTTKNYIAASYVKFLEASGAQVVQIPYDAPHSTLDIIFENINGILLAGGATFLEEAEIFHQENSFYTQQVAYLFSKAMAENDKGNYFPVMGICLGHEAIHYILSGFNDSYKISVKGHDKVTAPLNIISQSAIYITMDEDLYQKIQQEKLFYYHHSYAIPIETYELTGVKENLRIVAIDQDTQGKSFVSSCEGIKYPILCMQYHPEKNPYEFTINANHSSNAIKVTQAHSNTFVNMARKNNHEFNLSQYLIYNYETAIPSNNAYSLIYILDKIKTIDPDQ